MRIRTINEAIPQTQFRIAAAIKRTQLPSNQGVCQFTRILLRNAFMSKIRFEEAEEAWEKIVETVQQAPPVQRPLHLCWGPDSASGWFRRLAKWSRKACHYGASI